MVDTSDNGQVEDAVANAQAVMTNHITALNASDAQALAATLHFPHYRLSGGRLKTWQESQDYLADFYARVGDDWHHSAWDAVDVICADADKVHLDVRFTRYREDQSIIGHFRSLWVIAKIDGVWAAQLRSTFAP